MHHETPAQLLVVGNGHVPSRAALDDAWPGWSAGVGWVVGADGGAARALALGFPPDLAVGDFDSLTAADATRLAASGTPLQAYPPHKDASDLELALRATLAHGPGPIVILGALSGPRFDHALAAVWLLALRVARGREITLLDERSRVRLLSGPGSLELAGRPADLVTLLPFGGPARGVRTRGLAYALQGETLPVGPSRGLSNVRSGANASIELDHGRLLVVESHPLEVTR